MVLQPEGRVNAEARLLAGEVQLERGNFDDDGKAFMGVLCSMMIQPLLRARWTKRHPPTSELARTRKQIGWPGSSREISNYAGG